MDSSFSAKVITGSGRGKSLGTPTINLDPAALTTIGRDGIYAVWASIGSEKLPAVMHAGGRPVFQDTPSVEIHLLERVPETLPETITVEIVQYLRPVENFPSVPELQAQIARDVALARATLGLHDAPAEKGHS